MITECNRAIEIKSNKLIISQFTCIHTHTIFYIKKVIFETLHSARLLSSQLFILNISFSGDSNWMITFWQLWIISMGFLNDVKKEQHQQQHHQSQLHVEQSRFDRWQASEPNVWTDFELQQLAAWHFSVTECAAVTTKKKKKQKLYSNHAAKRIIFHKLVTNSVRFSLCQLIQCIKKQHTFRATIDSTGILNGEEKPNKKTNESDSHIFGGANY